MLQTIKGIYNNGQLTLEEALQKTKPTEVLVTFTGNLPAKPKNKLVFGFARGRCCTYLSILTNSVWLSGDSPIAGV